VINASFAVAYSALVAEIPQATFTRAVRGDNVKAGVVPDIEPVVKGISSISRAAVRKVHKESPELALSYFAGKVSRFLLMGGRPAATADTYRNSLLQYIDWDKAGEAADLDVGARVSFGNGNWVRARSHVVIERNDESREARVLLWDDLPLNEASAEMIALPIVECVNSQYGDGSVGVIEVWQLARSQRYSVAPASAEARRGDVEDLLSSL
jgi:hypothetical protein